ncbi:hypothetical protein JCM8547_004744 [Rhodosporidiobolus lusitaniae]
MNREGAESALSVARSKLAAGETASAIRFAKKSLALHPTSEAQSLLEKAEQAQRDGPSSSSSSPPAGDSPSASTSATSSGPSASSTSSRRPAASSSSPFDAKAAGGAHTPAQAAMVARVKKCKVTAYYEILELQKSCGDGEVKKAYRKLALGLHPDKNLAPGAEEAFKMVSKAFTVLSDPQKRAIYDQTGGDPESRGGGGGGGGGGGFARHPGFSRGGFGGDGDGQEELSPEDLFRFFFGQGSAMGGGPFGGPMGSFGSMGMGGGPFGGTSFQFFGPVGGGFGHNQHRPQARAGQQGGQAGQRQSAWVQMAPLLLLFAFSFLTQLPNLFGGGTPKTPEFSFEQNARFSHPRTTLSSLSTTQYFVDPSTFPLHLTYRSFARSNAASLNFDPPPSAGENSPAYRSALQTAFSTESQWASEATAAAVVVESAKEVVKEKGKDALSKEEKGQLKEAEKTLEKVKKRREGLRKPREWQKFERGVDQAWVGRLQSGGGTDAGFVDSSQINQRDEALRQASGFLGIGTDHDAIARITKQRLEHCEALSKVPGYGHVRYD